MSNDNKRTYRPRKMPTQSRSKSTYKAILDAAARILVNEGYDSVTTNYIAEVAGVSIGSLYEYFASKDAIFVELSLRTNEHSFNSISQIILDSPLLTPSSLIETLTDKIIELTLDNNALQSALQNQVPLYILREENQRFFGQFSGFIHTYLEQHKNLIRNKNQHAAIEFGMRLPPLIVGYTAATDPEQLKTVEFRSQLIDLMSRYYLVDP